MPLRPSWFDSGWPNIGLNLAKKFRVLPILWFSIALAIFGYNWRQGWFGQGSIGPILAVTTFDSGCRPSDEHENFGFCINLYCCELLFQNWPQLTTIQLVGHRVWVKGRRGSSSRA